MIWDLSESDSVLSSVAVSALVHVVFGFWPIEVVDCVSVRPFVMCGRELSSPEAQFSAVRYVL